MKKLTALALLLSCLFLGIISRGQAEDAQTQGASAPTNDKPPDAVKPTTETALAEPSAPPPAAAAESQGADEGEYEIDYEEEPGGDGDEAEEVPAPQPKKGKKSVVRQGGGAEITGSRAMHRFTPILKSETKSVYKKDGKALDVDTD